MVSGEYFVVEMSYNNRGFFISCFGLEDATKQHIMEIMDPLKANYILNCFTHDYDKLAEHLKIVKGRLRITIPQGHMDLDELQ
jgi:hypothetical protein